jgi:hypothetical protein
MKRKLIVLVGGILSLAGCTTLMNTLQTATSSGTLTETDVISGLKEALIVGAKNSSGVLSAVDGYYKDATVKILLPDEAKVIIANISKIPGGEKLVENVILSINRAAEDAAKDAAPIFVNSVKSMTIADGFNILKGTDNAATMYLRNTTYNDLYTLYKPKIEASTKKDIIGTVSTQESWNALTGKWNTFANSIPGKIAGFKPVNIDLNDFLTRKALDGMFLKIAGEELKIRKDVSARVSPLLKKVFGSLN